MKPMDKTYDPQAIEQALYASWEESGCFAPTGAGEPYCIMIPPPNVTGTLHMGHAFQDTIMDLLTRYHRMQGHRALWQPGTDHAGIATQMVVERQLQEKGLSRHDLGREKFVEKVWEWKAHSGNTIAGQLRRLGASVDWSRERFTMDDGLSRAVVDVFVSLYEQGLIYRGKRLVNWDPKFHTAISDLEVQANEESGKLWHLRYPVADTDTSVVVATTRPETMLGDTAVAVHPEDKRYAHLVGKSVRLPLTDREIPVIADDYVDPEFGSGCVKITPAHDFNDYEIGLRHDLEMINILTPDASLNNDVPEPYRGLDRFAARDAVVRDLDAQGFLERVEDHSLKVPRGDRSGVVVEPYLTDQWFVKIDDLAQPAIAAVREKRIRFVPERWSRVYFEWMENIQDWCISRQLWWGHRIPAWYDDAGNIYVGRDEADARSRNGLGADVRLSQDPDVLDTWFSSALWPFSTLGWPEKTDALAEFYPTNVLVTGFDIIFFWVARMIMMGLKFAGDVPFREVYIHPLIRDAEGQKMSKSKGNVIDPLDLIVGADLDTLVRKRTESMMQPQLKARVEKATREHFPDGIRAFGTDPLRFTFASLATMGDDVTFDLGRIDGYAKFCNKLWQASRFVLMNTEEFDHGDGGKTRYTQADRWIKSRLARAIADVREGFDTYRFDHAARDLYEFTWNEFCDWHLELAKPVLRSGDEAAVRGTRETLLIVLEALLRLTHPIMPFITESIWLRVAPRAGRAADTIMLAPYPAAGDFEIDEAADAEIDWLKSFVLGIRRIRGEMGIEPKRRVPVLLQDATADDLSRVDANRQMLETLARTGGIEVLADGQDAPQAATALLGRMKILLPMAGLIDVDAELERLAREIGKIEQDREKSEKKLANEAFVRNAPSAVVEQERGRVSDMTAAIERLVEQRQRVEALSKSP